MRPAVKPQALDRPSAASVWWSRWLRHRLPHLVNRRVYVTDIDGLAWLPYQHEGREKVRLVAVLEIVPWNADLEARRSSMTALQALAARAGLRALIIEVDHRRSLFRVRTMRGQHVLVGPVEAPRRPVSWGVWSPGSAGRTVFDPRNRSVRAASHRFRQSPGGLAGACGPPPRGTAEAPPPGRAAP